MSDREQPLRVEITDEGLLLISIGIETLGHAVELKPGYSKSDGSSAVTITNIDQFAAAVALELESEEEDGTTLVHIALDEAADQAIENGAEGIDYDEGDLE